MNSVLNRLNARRKPNLIYMGSAVSLALILELLKHYILSLIDEFVGSETGTFAAHVQHASTWLFKHPFVLIAVGFVFVIVDYVSHRHDKSDSHSSNEPAASNATASATTNPTVTVSPTVRQQATANPTVMANPILTANPTVVTAPTFNQEVHIHNHPEPPSRQKKPSALPDPDDAVLPNIVLGGVSLIKTDTVQEYFDDGPVGVPGIVARFHNESIPGERGVDFDYVRASVTFRGRNSPSVVFTDSPASAGRS